MITSFITKVVESLGLGTATSSMTVMGMAAGLRYPLEELRKVDFGVPWRSLGSTFLQYLLSRLTFNYVSCVIQN